MSWSVSATGFPAAVLKSIQGQAMNKCVEPEETIKQKLLEAISLALGAMPTDYPVIVKAGGSQGGSTPPVTNNFNVSIEPIWQFLHDIIPETDPK